MTALLDVNVLVALAWPNHVHHEAAHRWFSTLRGERSWATCPVTQSGFVRVSSNPATTPGARSPNEALEVLRRMVARPGHVFWPDDLSLVETASPALVAAVGHRQITDAHLIALAVRRGGRVATFDRGLVDLAADIEVEAVEVIGSGK